MSGIYAFVGSGINVPRTNKKNNACNTYVEARCPFLKVLYPFLSPGQIKLKAKEEWNKQSGNTKVPKARNNTPVTKKKGARQRQFVPLDVNIVTDNKNGILKRKSMDQVKRVSFSNKTEVKVKTPSIEGTPSAKKPPSQRKQEKNSGQEAKNQMKVSDKSERINYDKPLPSATWSYKIQRDIKIQSLEKNADGRNLVEAVISEERRVVNGNNGAEEESSDYMVNPTPETPKKPKTPRKRQQKTPKPQAAVPAIKTAKSLQNSKDTKRTMKQTPVVKCSKTRKKTTSTPRRASAAPSIQQSDSDSDSEVVLLTRRSVSGAPRTSESDNSCCGIQGSPVRSGNDEDWDDDRIPSSFDSLLAQGSVVSSKEEQASQNESVVVNEDIPVYEILFHKDSGNEAGYHISTPLTKNSPPEQVAKNAKGSKKKGKPLHRQKRIELPTENLDVVAMEMDQKDKTIAEEQNYPNNSSMDVDSANMSTSAVVNSEQPNFGCLGKSDSFDMETISNTSVQSKYNLRIRSPFIVYDTSTQNWRSAKRRKRMGLSNSCQSSSIDSTPVKIPRLQSVRCNLEALKRPLPNTSKTMSSPKYLEKFSRGPNQRGNPTLKMPFNDSVDSSINESWSQPDKRDHFPLAKKKNNTEPRLPYRSRVGKVAKQKTSLALTKFDPSASTFQVDKIVSQIRRCSIPLDDIFKQGTHSRENMDTGIMSRQKSMQEDYAPTGHNNEQTKMVVKMQTEEMNSSQDSYFASTTVTQASMTSSTAILTSRRGSSKPKTDINSSLESSSQESKEVDYYANLLEHLVAEGGKKKLPPPRRDTRLPVFRNQKPDANRSRVDEKWDSLLSSVSMKEQTLLEDSPTVMQKPPVTPIIKALQGKSFNVWDIETMESDSNNASEIDVVYDASVGRSQKNSKKDTVQDTKNVKRKASTGKNEKKKSLGTSKRVSVPKRRRGKTPTAAATPSLDNIKTGLFALEPEEKNSSSDFINVQSLKAKRLSENSKRSSSKIKVETSIKVTKVGKGRSVPKAKRQERGNDTELDTSSLPDADKSPPKEDPQLSPFSLMRWSALKGRKLNLLFEKDDDCFDISFSSEESGNLADEVKQRKVKLGKATGGKRNLFESSVEESEN